MAVRKQGSPGAQFALLIGALCLVFVGMAAFLGQGNRNFSIQFLIVEVGSTNPIGNVKVEWSKFSSSMIGDFSLENQPPAISDGLGIIFIPDASVNSTFRFSKAGYLDSSCRIASHDQIFLLYPVSQVEGGVFSPTSIVPRSNRITVPLIPIKN